MTRHIIEALGKSKIIIENEKVVEVSKPQINYCPLFDHHRCVKEITEEFIENNINFRIEDFGMCTPKRQLKMKDFLAFGISEILSTLIKEKEINCAIMVCEGCGTIIVTESEMAQGVGGRVSGLVETEPIPELIKIVGSENVLDNQNASIDQVKGIELAISQGYKNIAVTIALASDCEKINKIKEENPDVNIYTFAVHTTGLSKEEARIIFDNCDVITSCASKHIRDIGDEESVRTVGQSIPIYSATEKGAEFLELRLSKIGGEKPKKTNPDIPKPLI
ncbi:MAG: DUF2099 family protein [archaeon]|nr:DUF2099 family protein [archaeon]